MSVMGKVNSVQFLEYSGGCGGRGSGQYSVVVGEVCSMLCSVKYVWWSGQWWCERWCEEKGRLSSASLSHLIGNLGACKRKTKKI